MSAWLYLLPEGLEAADADWPCWWVDASGVVQQMTLQAGARACQGRAVTVIVPVEAFSSVLSDPWPGRRRPSHEALGYAVEERLAVELEHVRLFIARRDDQRRYRVWVTARQTHEHWHALFRRLGIELEGLYIDADRLPAAQAFAHWCAGRWLVGGEHTDPMALDANLLNALEDRLPETLQGLDPPHEPLEVQFRPLLEGHPHALDLLPPRPVQQALPSIGRAGAAVLWLTLLATLGIDLLASQRYEHDARQLQQRAIEHLQRSFPDQPIDTDLQAQLSRLQRAPALDSRRPVVRLGTFAEQLQGQAGVRLVRAQWQVGQGWQLHVEAATLAQLERVDGLGRAGGLSIEAGPVQQEDGQVRAVIIIKEPT